MRSIRYRIRYFLINLKNILKVKLIFKKPPQKEILLFDFIFDDFIKKFFKNKLEVLHLRLETFNAYIAYKVLTTNGIKNFSKNYILTYIECVSPKLLLTFSDLHPTFYLLKNYLKSKKTLTMAVQAGFRTYKSFYNFNKNEYYSSSTSCIFADSYKDIYSKHIKSDKTSVGSIKNNYFKKIKKQKQKKIIFISQFRPEIKKTDIKQFKREQEILKYLDLFCEKNKVDYLIATKPSVTKKVYYKNFKFGKNSKVISEKNPSDLFGEGARKKYALLDSSELTVFIDSSLGLESLSRRNKVLSYPFLSFKKTKKNPFWVVNSKKNDFLKKLSTVYKMSNREWTKKIKNNQYFLIYNPGNKILIKLIKNIIK